LRFDFPDPEIVQRLPQLKKYPRGYFFNCDGDRDSLKEFRRLVALIDDRFSTDKFFSTNDVPFEFVGHVRVCLDESMAAERFCNLINI
jgi:hypothetical protein